MRDGILLGGVAPIEVFYFGDLTLKEGHASFVCGGVLEATGTSGQVAHLECVSASSYSAYMLYAGKSNFTSRMVIAGKSGKKYSAQGSIKSLTTLYGKADRTQIRAVLTQASSQSIVGESFSVMVVFSSLGGKVLTDVTGQVEFYDGPILLGVSFVDATGIATLIVRDMKFGTHSISAYYRGDTGYYPAQTHPKSHVVKGGYQKYQSVYSSSCRSNILIGGQYVCVSK